MRSWVAFAALGAGILHLALAPGAPPPIAAVMLVLGAAEFCWGVAVLARGRYVVAGIARGVALAPIIGWAMLLLAARLLAVPELGASPTLVPMGVATLFDFVIAITLSVSLRNPRAAPASGEGNTWAHLGGLLAGGLAVSVLMTPALSFTAAGITNPHASHGSTTVISDAPFPEHQGH